MGSCISERLRYMYCHHDWSWENHILSRAMNAAMSWRGFVTIIFIYPPTPVPTILAHFPCTTYDINRFEKLKKTLELNLPIATRLRGTLLQTDNSDSLLSKNHHQLTVLLFNYAKERINQKKLEWKINLMAWKWEPSDKIFLYGKTTINKINNQPVYFTWLN